MGSGAKRPDHYKYYMERAIVQKKLISTNKIFFFCLPSCLIVYSLKRLWNIRSLRPVVCQKSLSKVACELKQN